MLFPFFGGQKSKNANVNGTRRNKTRSAVRTIRATRLNLEPLEQRVVLSALATSALIEAPTIGIASDAVTTTGAWTAVTNASWLHPTAGTSSGTGNGTAIFTIDANTGPTRVGTLTIAGETLTVTQAGSTYVAAYPVTVPVGGSSVVSGGPVAIDNAGNIYFASGTAIEEWHPATGTVSTVIPSGVLNNVNAPIFIAVDHAGNLYLSETDHNYNWTVVEWNAATQTVTGPLIPNSYGGPGGIAVDAAGNLYTCGINIGVSEFNAANPQGLLLSGNAANQYTSGLYVDAASNVYWSSIVTSAVYEYQASTQTITQLFGGRAYGGISGDDAGNLTISPGGGVESVLQWNAATQTETTMVFSYLVEYYAGVAVDASGNVYTIGSGGLGNGLLELPRTFVPTGPVSETAAAGSDSLLPVLDTEPLLGQFAPTSNQSWLTINSVAGDVVNFSFTQNTTGAARSATITVLGNNTTVTQSATAPPTVTTPTSASLTGSSALLGGDVTSAGLLANGSAASITHRGFVYAQTSVNASPTIGGTGVTVVPDSANTTGVFTDTVSSLQSLTGYSYAAFATTSVGTSYSPVATFSTLTGAPTLAFLGTTSATEGGAGFNLTVTGTNFTSNSTVDWNGTALATTFGSVTSLTAAVPAADLAEEGSANVTVVNPGAGGGTSGALAFAINDAPLTAGLLSPPSGTGMGTASTYASGLVGPSGLAFDATGNLYVATGGNNGQVNKVTPEGVVTTFATGIYQPAGLAFDAAGNLYVATGGNNGQVNKVTPEGVVTTFATGIYQPAGLAFDAAGNLYVASYGSGDVDKVTPLGAMSTFATGFNGPAYLAFDAAGNLYVSNLSGEVDKVTPEGASSVFVAATGSNTASGLAFDAAGNLYVASATGNSVSKVTSAGVITPFATGFNDPNGLSIDAAGNLYVDNIVPGTVSKVTPEGVVSTYATGLGDDQHTVFDAAGNLYVGNVLGTTVVKLTPPPPVEGQAFSNETVFQFTDADPNGTASDYTAVVALGDGNSVTLTGTPSANGQIVADPNGGFDVQLSYTYAEELTNATFSVTVTDAGGSTTSTSTSTFNVADAPVTATATPVTTAVYGTAFSGEVATFTDANPSAPLSDFPLANVTINWGDGTTSNATSVTETGTTFHVFGNHTYDAAGATANPLTVTIADVGGSVSNTTRYTPTVAQAALTITANNASMVYGGTLPAFSASYSGFVNGDTSTSLTTRPTLTTTATASSHVGSYAITIGGAFDANYAITYVAGSLGVTPAALTITGNNASMVYGGVLPALSASYSGFVNGDTAASLTTAPTLSANAADHVGGANPITPAGAVDPDYAITYVPGTLTVTPAALVISGNSSSVYGASPILTASYFGLENGDTGASLTTQPTLTTTATSASHVGTYPVTISGAVDPDYVIGYQVSTLTVTPAALSITSNATNVYGTALPTLTVVYTGFVNGDTAAKLTTRPTLSTTATATSHVGSYPSTISGAVDPNYTISYVTGTLTVTPAALKITANNASMVYGAPLPALTASYTGFVNGDTAASLTTAPILSANAASHVGGTNPITASGAVDPDYTITYVAGKLTVTPAALVITANPSSMVYGAPLPILSASYSGFVNGDMAASLTVAPTLSASAADHVGGANPITASKAVDPDYSISYVSGTLTVTPASLVITANNLGNVYGSGLPGLTASYSGLVNGDTDGKLTTAPTLSTTAMASSPVGGYPITVSGAVDSDYTISYLSGTMSVTPAPLTITASNATMIYGAAVPTLTVSYKGFVNGDTAASLTTAPSLSTTATTASHVGGYTNTASGAAASNYSISYVAGTLTVNPKALTITASPASMVYGSSLPSLNVSYSGFVNGDTVASLTTAPTVSTTATAASPVGSYAITASGAQDNDYTIHYTTGTLSVTRASLTITADNLSRTAGDPAVVLTATYAGLMNGDLPAVVTGLTLASTGNSTNTAGTYAITAKGAAAANYTITLVNGTLTVLPATATHLVLSAPSKVYVNTPFQLVATAYDAYGNIATGYTGTVLLTRTDGAPVSYTFLPTENGVHIFTVTVTSKGLDRFVVSDQNDGSIVGAELDRTF